MNLRHEGISLKSLFGVTRTLFIPTDSYAFVAERTKAFDLRTKFSRTFDIGTKTAINESGSDIDPMREVMFSRVPP